MTNPNPAIGRAVPKSEEDKAKMQAKTGKPYFEFKAKPTVRPIYVFDKKGFVSAYWWHFNAIDPDIKIAMVRDMAKNRGMLLEEADANLSRTGAFFTKADLEIIYYNAE